MKTLIEGMFSFACVGGQILLVLHYATDATVLVPVVVAWLLVASPFVGGAAWKCLS